MTAFGSPDLGPKRPALGEGGRGLVAEVLSFERLVCPAFCDSRLPALG